MNMQYNLHFIKKIFYRNISSLNKKNIKWKDNIDKYCLAERGLLSELDVNNTKLEDNKCEKMDLMEKGLYYNTNKNNNEEIYRYNNDKNIDYGVENYIEEIMYYNN